MVKMKWIQVGNEYKWEAMFSSKKSKGLRVRKTLALVLSLALLAMGP